MTADYQSTTAIALGSIIMPETLLLRRTLLIIVKRPFPVIHLRIVGSDLLTEFFLFNSSVADAVDESQADAVGRLVDVLWMSSLASIGRLYQPAIVSSQPKFNHILLYPKERIPKVGLGQRLA